MNRSTPAAAALLLAAALAGTASAQQVTYEIAFPNAVHHEAEVEVVFEGVAPDQTLEVRMSRTSPGRYPLHEFAKNVYEVRAFDGRGSPLELARPDPHQWNALTGKPSGYS